MPTELPVKDIDSPYYLLVFNQDNLDTFTEDEDLLEELGSIDQQNTDSDDQQTIENSAVPEHLLGSLDPLEQRGACQITVSSPLCSTRMVQREKQTVYSVPEARSNVEGLLLFSDLLTSFTCDIVCGQTIRYKLLTNANHNPHDLDKLDIVLDENSVLKVQVHCTLNGLDVLEYPPWMTEALNEVMNKLKFVNITPSPEQENQQGENSCSYQFGVQRAFVTTPISYLLEKQAPHGVLDKISLHMDWCTNKGSKEFQLVWTRGFQREVIMRYVEDALFEILVRRVFNHYPLISSNFHVKRLAPTISYLPHMSQSLNKIMRTARNTSANTDFVQRFSEKVKIIEKNTLILRPQFSKDDDDTNRASSNSTATALTLGMYYTIAKQQQKKTTQVSTLQIRDSPDALEAIKKIWSITCSSAAPTLTEQL